MKKLINIFLLAFFIIGMLPISSIAQGAPISINGRVTGEHVSNLPIDIQNLRTSDTVTKTTSLSGEYIADVTEFKNSIPLILNGDVFRITITSCNTNTACVKQVTYSGQDEMFLEFNLEGIDIGVQPDPDPTPEEDVANKASPSESKESATVEVEFGQSIDLKLDNSKVSKLIDGQADLDGESYDVEEEIYFKGTVLTSIDNDDFGMDPYLTINDREVEYRYVFTEDIDTSQISTDDPLEIDFLGKTIRVIEAESDSITIRTGEEHFLSEGEGINVAGKILKLETVFEHSVLVSVDGTTRTIGEDDSQTVNDIHVIVDQIGYKGAVEGSSAVLIIGTESDEKVTEGEYFELFEKDSEEWEWTISLSGADQYIGIVNTETYESIDDEEEYKAIPIGGGLTLPNDYLQIQFKSITEVERTSLDFEVKDSRLYVRGNKDDAFNFGNEEYDRIYVDSDGIYDDDLVIITTDKVEIGDSDVFLELGSVKIGDLTIELDMSDILHTGVSFKFEEEIFLDHSGLIFKDPEKGVNDKDNFEVTVPEEVPEALIVFRDPAGIEEVPEEEVPVDETEAINETKKEETTTKECPETKDPVCPEHTCPDCPAVKEGISWGDMGVGTLLGLIVAIIGFMGGGLKIYAKRVGGVALQHRHRGVRGYHDVNTRHKNTAYRHRALKDDPVGFAQDVKKINEEGGLK